jgi:peptide/nickel transport system substrate-binding protein
VLGSGAAATLGILGVRAQDDATPAATPNASPGPATPVASPVAATPTPTPTPVMPPESIGQLTVVREQRPQYTAERIRGGGVTLVRVGKGNIDFNPASFAQDFQIPVSYLEPLVWIDGVTQEPQPWLATAWEWNEDATEITYRLRDGVRWHDNERFTARDVVFSFYVYRDDYNSAVYTLFTNMVEAEAVDDLTVRVRLSAPDGNWIRNASSQLIFQREQYGPYWDAQPEGQRTLAGYNWPERKPLGTGPWIVVDRRDSRVDFDRNREYWDDTSLFVDLRVDFVSEPAQLLSRWHDGSADVVWPVAPADLDSVSDRPGKVYAAESLNTMFAAFNFENPARTNPSFLTDLRVRQALSLAIDRHRYAGELFRGFFRPGVASTIIQPDLHLDTLENPRRDVTRAHELLAEAGFSNRRGDGILRGEDGSALKFDVIVRRGDSPELEAILASIEVDLEEAGIQFEVRPLSPERFETTWITDRTYDLIAFAYSLYPGFTDFDLYGSAWDIRTNIQGFNPGGYKNDKVDRAIDRALTATSDDDYQSALHAIQRQVADEDLFALWFGTPLEAVLVQADIRGFQPNKQWQTWQTNRLWRTR